MIIKLIKLVFITIILALVFWLGYNGGIALINYIFSGVETSI